MKNERLFSAAPNEWKSEYSQFYLLGGATHLQMA